MASGDVPKGSLALVNADYPHQIENQFSELTFEWLEEFIDIPLIYENRNKIRQEYFKGKAGLSMRTSKGRLKFIASSLRKFQAEGNVDDVGHKVPRAFFYYFMARCRETADPAKRYRDLVRLLECIGIDPSIVPINPFAHKQAEPRSVPDERQARTAFNLAKNDAREIVKRFEQAKRLEPFGHDPRRKMGGKFGDWDDLRNRLFLCRQLLKEGKISNEDLQDRDGWSVLGGLRDRVGAVTIDPNKGPVQPKGLISHLNYYHPSANDLFPFIILLMLRGMLNLSTACDIKVTDKWNEPYNWSLDASDPSDHVMIVLLKHRGASTSTSITAGANDKLSTGTPNAIRFPSLRKPWSHPYRVIEFLHKLTEPLRLDVRKRIERLRLQERREPKEEEELAHLVRIRDDLLLYRSNQGINSYRNLVRHQNGVTQPMIDMLRRYGLSGRVRELRDAGLTFSFQASGWNLLIIRMLASHRNSITSNIYARRQQTLTTALETMRRVAGQSMLLVRTGSFSVESLRKALAEQGLPRAEVDNILDETKRSRFGNGCANPTAPPTGFSYGTPPGEMCRGQNCIDGCINARFFPA